MFIAPVSLGIPVQRHKTPNYQV